MRALVICAGLLAVALPSCQSPGGQPPAVKPELLAHVPAGRVKAIDAARAHHASLQTELAAARRDVAEARSHLDVARQNLETMDARYDEASARMEHAREFGTNAEIEREKKNRSDVCSALRLARAKVGYYEDLRELASRRAGLVEKRVELAAAELEFEKARAVSKLDRPAARDVDVEDYRDAVAMLTDDVEKTRIEAKVARERVRLQSDYVGERTRDVPESMRLAAIEPVESVLEAEAFAHRAHPANRADGNTDRADGNTDERAAPQSDRGAEEASGDGSGSSKQDEPEKQDEP